MLEELGAEEGDTLRLRPTGRTAAGHLKADMSLMKIPSGAAAEVLPAGTKVPLDHTRCCPWELSAARVSTGRLSLPGGCRPCRLLLPLCLA